MFAGVLHLLEQNLKRFPVTYPTFLFADDQVSLSLHFPGFPTMLQIIGLKFKEGD